MIELHNMKFFNLYFLLITIILTTTACRAPAPKVETTKSPEQVVQTPKQETIISKVDTDFVEENYVQDDAYTRVYTNCFETGETKLNKSCQTKIETFLKSVPLSKKRNIIFEVHTDKSGNDENNLVVSKKRAYAVADSLYYKEYKYSKVYYKGFGEEKPLYNSQTQKANVENRRIVLHVQDKNTAVNKKLYTLYVKSKKVSKPVVHNVKVETTTQTQTISKVKLLNYTGEADIGWIYFGKEELKDKFKISCAEDSPIKVKRRNTQYHSENEFISGVHNRSLLANFGDYGIRMTPISVFDDGYLPKTNPSILLLETKQPNKALTTIVNSYRGKKGMLYRVFIDKKNSVKNDLKCIDIVIPYKNAENLFGVAYFTKNKKTFYKELKDILYK